MKVHFKGTRGSIPTAPTAKTIREKVVATLLAARGKDLRSETQIREFVKEQLPFQHGHTYGGNTPCLNIETGSDEYLIFDGGSGIRPLGKEILEEGTTGKTFHIFCSHFQYDHVKSLNVLLTRSCLRRSGYFFVILVTSKLYLRLSPTCILKLLPIQS
mgnify:CR=1 FL=1